MNQKFQDLGIYERVDCRSNADRGLEELVTEYLGPEAANIERRSDRLHRSDCPETKVERSIAGDINRDIQKYNEAVETGKKTEKVITDGEYRRGWYHSDFLASLNGVKFATYTMNLFGLDTLVGSTTIAERITWNENHPFIDHFKFAKRAADLYGVTTKDDQQGAGSQAGGYDHYHAHLPGQLPFHLVYLRRV